MKVSQLEHEAFIQDCKDGIIYFNYLKHQFKCTISFDEVELQKYHKAYVILRHSWKDYNGSFLIKQIQDIVTSNKTPEERYSNYKKCLDNEIEIYNKVHTINKHKQIRIS